MNKFFIQIFIFLSLFIPLISFAYSETNQGDSVAAIVSPELPAPGGKVQIRLESYAVDLDASTIEWRLNGQVKAAEMGKKAFVFNAGPAGAKDTLEISIRPINGSQTTKELVFQSGNIDLLWETDTHVPPFYKGKALPTSESLVKVVAFPELFDGSGQPIKPESLIYHWSKDGKNVSAASGYGKRTFYYKTEKIPGGNSIGVTISTPDSSVEASKQITIYSGNPVTLLYEVRPLLGINYNQAIGSQLLVGEEISVQAEPYYFPKSDLDSLTYQWTLGGKTLRVEENKDILTFKKDGDTDLQSVLALTVLDPLKVFLESRVSASLFTQKKSLSF